MLVEMCSNIIMNFSFFCEVFCFLIFMLENFTDDVEMPLIFLLARLECRSGFSHWCKRDSPAHAIRLIGKSFLTCNT